MIAEIIVNSNAKALNRIFDYIVPKEMEKEIFVGARIYAPFGKGNKLEDGFVIGLKSKSEFAQKEIAKIIYEMSIPEEKMELAKLMARKYFCNISDCIKLMLPPGTGGNKSDTWAKEKTGNFVCLAKEETEIVDAIESNEIKSEKHKRILEFLLDNGEVYLPDLEKILEVTSSVFKTLEKKGYIEVLEKQIERNPFVHKDIKRDKPKKLNEEQRKAYDLISKDIENEKSSKSLIYGITGSGKTEIYMQLISKAIELGKSAIMLVPEISLTPQMVDRFLARFGEQIAILHSKLSIGERYDEWQKIAEGKAKIVIGARSAIFAPVNNLGIIIIDEEHDMSYKSDMAPRYHAKEIAKYLGQKTNCPLVLGSATPDISSYKQALDGDINLFKLSKRANDASLPKIDIVDLRQELAIGNRSMLSGKLQKEIAENIKNKKQTILFLNRRGYSTFLLCRECGEPVKCPNCSISLTYHKYENILKCHYCGLQMPVLKKCPNCNSDKIKYFGTGTQKLEDEIHQIFPEASTIRMDIDTVSKKNSHEEILNKFKNENIDILIGTQMVVKGHHFPNVTLVGVIAADGALNIEDYNSSQRTFQTLVQVAGRAGRESERGRVIIQTYNPDHYAITYSSKQDYELFYNAEIELRKMLKYPPFCDIIMVRFVGKNITDIEKISNEIYKNLENLIDKKNTFVYKPIPSPVDKIKNKYRWRIILKGKVNNNMLNILYKALDIKKVQDVSISVDINPNNMI